MKLAFALIFSLTLASGCTNSFQTQHTANYLIDSPNRTTVFNDAIMAAVNSGMVVLSSDGSSGFFIAEAARNPLLTFENAQLNVFVSSKQRSTLVSVSSSLRGQMVDYGAAANALNEFCLSLRVIYPRDVVC